MFPCTSDTAYSACLGLGTTTRTLLEGLGQEEAEDVQVAIDQRLTRFLHVEAILCGDGSDGDAEKLLRVRDERGDPVAGQARCSMD